MHFLNIAGIVVVIGTCWEFSIEPEVTWGHLWIHFCACGVVHVMSFLLNS